MGGGIRLGADATSRRAESLIERGLEGRVSSTRYRRSFWRWMGWRIDAERGLLGWKCLWDIPNMLRDNCLGGTCVCKWYGCYSLKQI